MRIIEHTHMISIPDNYSDLIPSSTKEYLAKLASFLQMNTILLEPASIQKSMISRSSWWYNTPTLSQDQIDFINIMHSTKFEFKEDALDRLEECYKEHLKIDTLKDWHYTKLAHYRHQIQASLDNGGHYVAGRFDSALRWYFISDIGHFQTSKALRSLVKVSNIVKPIKYDMTNNVVQMYATVLGLRDLGQYVGLTANKVGDLRQIIADRMNAELGIDTFTKDNTKPLFMIWAYNAGKRRLMEGTYKVETDFFTGRDNIIQVVDGLQILADGIDPDKVWSTWNNILTELVPSIVALKRVFNLLTRANPFEVAKWTLPDGSIAQYASVELMEKQLHWVSSDLKTRTHTHHRKELVAGTKSAGLLPRVIHSFDAYMMRQLVIRCAQQGIVVVPNHDSFIFDEVYTDVIMSLAKDLFIEILESTAFSDIVTELNLVKASLALRDQNNEPITVDRFGDKLTPLAIRLGTPMEIEEI